MRSDTRAILLARTSALAISADNLVESCSSIVKALTIATPCVASCMAPISRELNSTDSRVTRLSLRMSRLTVKMSGGPITKAISESIGSWNTMTPISATSEMASRAIEVIVMLRRSRTPAMFSLMRAANWPDRRSAK